MSVGEVVTAVIGGVATAGVLYAMRLMRRLVSNVTDEVKAIVAAPGEVKELRAAMADQRASITTNTQAIGNLSSTLERLARMAESRQANGGT